MFCKFHFTDHCLFPPAHLALFYVLRCHLCARNIFWVYWARWTMPSCLDLCRFRETHLLPLYPCPNSPRPHPSREPGLFPAFAQLFLSGQQSLVKKLDDWLFNDLKAVHKLGFTYPAEDEMLFLYVCFSTYLTVPFPYLDEVRTASTSTITRRGCRILTSPFKPSLHTLSRNVGV